MKTRRRILVKELALASFVCVLIFAVLVIALHVLQPQMNPVSHTISEYALGPYGYLMTLAFIMRGLGELFLVIGLMVDPMRSSRSWTGLALLALAAVCSFLVAIFPADLHHTAILLIHSISALLGFCSLVIAALFWSQRFRKDPRQWWSVLTSLFLGLFMLLSLLISVLSPSSVQGLTERVLEVFIIFWLCFMDYRLSTLTSSKSLSPS